MWCAPYIGGPVLFSNTWEHEAGLALGHYYRYREFYDQPTNDLGRVVESQGPDFSLTDFQQRVSNVMKDLRDQITAAQQSGDNDCNAIVNNDPSCTFRGQLNFRTNGAFAQCRQ